MSATDISREIDALGGEMNAFTTRETTTFYVKVLDQHLPQALDLLSDLFLHSRLHQKEIEKEKQVVLEEIRMVQDDPEDLIQELHAKLVMGTHPLSRPILGKASTILHIRGQGLLKYMDRHYRPEEIVVAVAGNFDQSKLEKMMTRLFGRYQASKATDSGTRWPAELDGGVTLKQKPGFRGDASLLEKRLGSRSDRGTQREPPRNSTTRSNQFRFRFKQQNRNSVRGGVYRILN